MDTSSYESDYTFTLSSIRNPSTTGDVGTIDIEIIDSSGN